MRRSGKPVNGYEGNKEMGIYLLSLSHKTAPLEIRSLFAYSEQQKEQVLAELRASGMVDEAVVLSTCNRTEIYCHGGEETGVECVLEAMEEIAVKVAKAEGVPDLGRHLRRYYGRKAIHHLFLVAAGLDSMVIGEDQILGQVKQAYDFSRERGYCGTFFNTLFRDAVTGAKKVKTETILSKTPVSTASLAVKAAEEKLGGLAGKKMMIIGATGKIGNIVLKNAQDIKGLTVYVTMRVHSSAEKLGHGLVFRTVPFEERYQWMDEMDVVLSATSSPHYTVTRAQAAQNITTEKERVFLDLAVPVDIEESVAELPRTWYFNIEDMAELARQNNEKKQAEIQTADRIIEEYEAQFYKWMMFQSHRDDMERMKETIVQEICEKGAEAAINHLFYRMREAGTVEQVDGFLETVRQVNEDVALAAQNRPGARTKRKRAEQDAYFPLFFNLKGQPALVVGAGKIASHRAEILAEFGAEVVVVAPDGAEMMERLCRDGIVRWERRGFETQDIENRYMVIAATSDAQLNTEIAVLCKAQHILVNNAGDKSQCDFYFPGIAREGGIVAGVTTSGKDHGLAREITGQMQMWLKRFAE